MSNAIADAIAAAKANAGTTPGTEPGGLPATTGNAGAPATPGRKLSMDDMQGNLSVDRWLKVKEFGLVVGDHSGLFKTIRVLFDATEGVGFMPKLSLKYGNPAVYKNTYDGQSVIGGGRWADAVAEAQKVDARAAPYRSVDLPFKLKEDLMDGTTKVLEAGKTLGHSTSTTNWRNFETFWKDVQKRGLASKMIEVDLGFEPKANTKGNKWGVLTFTIIGEVGAAA